MVEQAITVAKISDAVAMIGIFENSRKFCASRTITPQLAFGGGKLSPRYARADSTSIASATCVEACNSSGVSMLGRMWRRTIRLSLAPSARAAFMNGARYKFFAAANVRRRKTGIFSRVIATRTASSPGLYRAVIKSAVSMAGNANSMSAAFSKARCKNTFVVRAAIRPSGIAHSIASATAEKAIVNDQNPPRKIMTRLSLP